MNDPSLIGAPPEKRTIWLAFTPGEAADILSDLPGGAITDATRDLYRRLLTARRNHQHPPPTMPDDDLIYAPMQTVRHPPDNPPRRAQIIVKRDATGTGVGIVADVLIASDGSSAIRWLGGPPRDQPSWQILDHPGTDRLDRLLGGLGEAELMWLDTGVAAPE